ncbi:MAG: T9SS type A sorting domain-containing protein [Bacteroidota bacterium]
MRSTFILLLTLACAQAATAQQPAIIRTHPQVLQALLQPQLIQQHASAKTTALKQRVIAQSTRYNAIDSLTDSLDMQYTGLRGSTYDYNMMLYPYDYSYRASPMFNYLGSFTKPQVLYDVCNRRTVDPFTNIYGMYETMYATYDTTKLTEYKDIFVDSATNDNMRYLNTFNTAGNITKGLWFNYNLGVSDSAFKQLFEYNSNGRLVKDSVYEKHLGIWKLAARTMYTYDAGNNLVQIDNYANTTDTSFTLPLIEQLKYVNTYDASNRLHTVLTSMYDGTALTQYVKDTFDYSGTLTFHNSWRQHQWDPINTYWAPMVYMQKHLNAASRPDTVSTYTFDSLANAWYPYYRDVITYNTQNNPLTMNNYIYNWTSFPATPDFTTTYYYETYNDPTGAGPIPAKLCGLLYPNPARNTVVLSQLSVDRSAAVVISIVNAGGQMLSRQARTYTGDMEISIADLVSGMYTIDVRDNVGALLYTAPVIKY